MGIRKAICALILAVGAWCAWADKPVNAQQAVEAWLAQLDAGDYTITWTATAPGLLDARA